MASIDDDNPGPVEFISEAIEPDRGQFSTEMMTQGLAALPRSFTWRGRRYVIAECLDHVKQSRPEGYTADGERYLRRQQFRVRLDSGQVATIYVERHARRGASHAAARKRWFLYTISATDGSGRGD